MNSKVFDTLEYAKVKQKIQKYLTTNSGANELKTLLPSSDKKVVEKSLDETDDGFKIIRLNLAMPIPRISDITSFMKRLRIDGILSSTELSKIKVLLSSVNDLNRFFMNLKDEKVEFKYLYKVINDFQLMPSIAQSLASSIDDSGKILDDASSELRVVRRQIKATEDTIRSKMNGTIKHQANKLSESIITIRDGRFVVPVKAEYKQSFGGIVHDQSASGQTLYMEPANVVESNNDLRRYQITQKQEERKVLFRLSNMLRPYENEIIDNFKILGHLDLINAKAMYARDLKATKPVISTDCFVNLKQARHPLIDQSKVVANDISLGRKYKTVIITGPNTGGKTITLKTLGLLQLMSQSGLFIPVSEESNIAVFDDVFADIGDDQSIEQNLSTFSSHMDNIVNILHSITDKSLVLLDELGAGTDPNEGATLAMSILDYIGSVDSTVMSTTHYPELKAYAYNRKSTINASMEFNVDSLAPTYHLLMGIPGQSNGLNIAERLGINESIINEARSLTSQDSQDLNNMIVELTNQTKKAREDYEFIHNQLLDSEKLHQELSEKVSKFYSQRDNLVRKAKEDANEIALNAKNKADAIIKDLHEKQANLGQASFKENELINAQGQLNSLTYDINLKNNKVLKKEKAKHDFHKGDDVLVKSYGQRGVLISKSGKDEWIVQMGILKMKINTADLEIVKNDDSNNQSKYTRVKRTKSSGMSTQLDLRGHRYDDAMQEVDRYLDAAILAGYPSVTIIHGKGTGALRKGVNKLLSKDRRVKSYNYSPANAGGDGSTVVTF
ncbi:endonuclease MutS2 [Apilactobacillus sp. M161]|uniref:Endonuclease MutS2 n=1 Tax=Apilactobacillus xinyiensis TaxID=2841032 RepID=A0ABT0I1S7_9LACO|nr:endonuclease MutS2 [Apilactobacillus xinyiensis]MCK8624666.1 endonuclease MutS2 [Apilactobacillus xinyiensis]